MNPYFSSPEPKARKDGTDLKDELKGWDEPAYIRPCVLASVCPSTLSNNFCDKQANRNLKVKVNKDQEMVHSERNSLPKNRGGK